MHLSAAQEAEIIQAIQEAEKKTSGEIRVHVESYCEGHPIERSKVLFFNWGCIRPICKMGSWYI